MATFLVRIELPDRPGALGAVASRIGAVRGDVVSIEIVRRADGRAVDEFVVELADADHVPLLLTEIAEVDGVSVEDVYPVSVGISDQRLDAYDAAATILEARTTHGVLTALGSRTREEFGAAWVAVVDVEQCMVIAGDGRPPAASWLAAHVRETSPSGISGGDVTWVHLAAWDLTLVVGRPTWRFSVREHDRLRALARLADARWLDLSERESRLSHPTCTA